MKIKYSVFILWFFVISCRDDKKCSDRLSFDAMVKEYVTYLPDHNNLLAAEEAMLVPIVENYKFDFCKTSNSSSKGTIINLGDVIPSQAPDNALGVNRNIEWTAKFDNNNLKVFREIDQLVDEFEVEKISKTLLDYVDKFKEHPLISDSKFESKINISSGDFTIEKLNNGDFKLLRRMPNGKKSETIMSKEFQREISHAIFTGQDEIESIHTWYYNKSGNSVLLESELFQVFTPSMDSDKTMVVSRLVKFENIVVR